MDRWMLFLQKDFKWSQTSLKSYQINYFLYEKTCRSKIICLERKEREIKIKVVNQTHQLFITICLFVFVKVHKQEHYYQNVRLLSCNSWVHIGVYRYLDLVALGISKQQNNYRKKWIKFLLNELLVASRTFHALISLGQILRSVRSDAFGVDQLSHTLSVHRPSHHRPVMYDQTMNVTINSSVEKSGVEWHIDAMFDGSYWTRATAEHP